MSGGINRAMSAAKTIRCTECRHEFADEEATGASCPNCGTEGVPMAIADDVTIRINWHELRILCMWASNFASTFTGPAARAQKALASIIRCIKSQHPEMPGLTLADDLQEVADHFNSTVEKHERGVVESFTPKRGPGQ